MAEEISIFIRPNENYTYKTPFQTINIVQMSEDEQDDPDPKPPTPPPTQISIMWPTTEGIETNNVNLPLQFSSQNTNRWCIGYSTDDEYNIRWGNYYSTSNIYRSDYETMWGGAAKTTISDFTLTQFMFYNISCSYLSSDEALSLGTDDIQTIEIEAFRTMRTVNINSSIEYRPFEWQSEQTYADFYFIYDKTDNIFYCTDRNNNYGLNRNHEQYFMTATYPDDYVFFKTQHGFFFAQMKGAGTLENTGIMKITNASKYFPSVRNL